MVIVDMHNVYHKMQQYLFREYSSVHKMQQYLLSSDDIDIIMGKIIRLTIYLIFL
jgi:hypothetical protein